MGKVREQLMGVASKLSDPVSCPTEFLFPTLDVHCVVKVHHMHVINENVMFVFPLMAAKWSVRGASWPHRYDGLSSHEICTRMLQLLAPTTPGGQSWRSCPPTKLVTSYIYIYIYKYLYIYFAN